MPERNGRVIFVASRRARAMIRAMALFRENSISFSEMVFNLTAIGWTYKGIAEEIGTHRVAVRKMFEIKDYDPKFSTGVALFQLHAKEMQRLRRARDKFVLQENQNAQ